jgi:hypothetical protein
MTQITIAQDNFDYDRTKNYTLNISGTVTGAPVTFFVSINYDGTRNDDGIWDLYTFNNITLQTGSFSQSIPLTNHPQGNSTSTDPYARLAFHFGNPGNGNITINSLSITADGTPPPPPPQNLWINPYSSMQPAAQGSFASSVTVTSNSIIVQGSSQPENQWDMQVVQRGFNYAKIGATSPHSPTDYTITVSGTVTGVPMTFEAGLHKDGPPYTGYLGTIVTQNPWISTVTVGPGQFTGTLKFQTTGNEDCCNQQDTNAVLFINLGYKSNAGSTMTITNVTVTGP